ncbi:MAG: biotin/lipoyl-containing protein [Clostridia bacterium]
MRKFNITVNGEVYEVEVEELDGEGQTLATPSRPSRPKTQTTQKPASTPKQEAAPAPKKESAPAVKPATVGEGELSVESPMPGVVLDVKVSEGEAVKENQVLLVLEAMKMENEVMSPRDGVIANVAVQKGSNVNAGDIMVVIK